MQPPKARGPARPARKAAKNVSYFEAAEDVFDEASPVESGGHSDSDDGDEREGEVSRYSTFSFCLSMNGFTDINFVLGPSSP